MSETCSRCGAVYARGRFETCPRYLVGGELDAPVSILVTVGVAQTLYVQGKSFVADALHGDVALAAAVSRLLRVGFLLTGLGLAAFILPLGARPWDFPSAIESFSVRIGVVMLALAALYFAHLGVLAAWRRRAAGVTSRPSS